jgi:hypothetical protein
MSTTPEPSNLEPFIGQHELTILAAAENIVSAVHARIIVYAATEQPEWAEAVNLGVIRGRALALETPIAMLVDALRRDMENRAIKASGAVE